MSRAKVRDCMTRDVVALRPDDGFKAVVRALAERGVSGAPVVGETGRVVGVVSEADLLHHESFMPVEAELRRYFESRRTDTARPGDTAADLMSSPAVTVSADAPIGRAARLMADHGIKRLPVVGADGKLVGIISRADLIGVFLVPDHQLRRQVIADVIERTLWQDPAGIRVEVSDGVVTLRGFVVTKSLIPVTVALTRAVNGVVDVVDELSYAQDDTAGGVGEPEDRR